MPGWHDEIDSGEIHRTRFLNGLRLIWINLLCGGSESRLEIKGGCWVQFDFIANHRGLRKQPLRKSAKKKKNTKKVGIITYFVLSAWHSNYATTKKYAKPPKRKFITKQEHCKEYLLRSNLFGRYSYFRELNLFLAHRISPGLKHEGQATVKLKEGGGCFWTKGRTAHFTLHLAEKFLALTSCNVSVKGLCSL